MDSPSSFQQSSPYHLATPCHETVDRWPTSPETDQIGLQEVLGTPELDGQVLRMCVHKEVICM